MHIEHHTIDKHPLFIRHVQARQVLLPSIKTRIYDKGAMVFQHGNAAGYLFLVLKGWVKLTRQTPDGKETIIGLCSEGDLLGEAALFPHANYPCYAESLAAETELAMIPSDLLRRVVAENTPFSATIMALLNTRTAQAQLKLEQMNTMSASQRLGCFLLRLCHTQADGAKTLQIPVEKHILAAYLGMKPETFSRSQQQLKAVGIAVAGHDVTVQDIGRLRHFVCNSCSESGSCDVEAAS